jgi:hypothetical protein
VAKEADTTAEGGCASKVVDMTVMRWIVAIASVSSRTDMLR